MVIKPEAIPQFTGDLGAVESHAASLNGAGGDFRSTGQDVHSTWQGLSAFYEAPEAATLFGATVKVRHEADQVGDDVQEVGAALTQYVQVMRPVVARLASLRSEADSFVAGIRDAGDDWREDEGKVDRNNDLIRQVDTQLAAMMAAERQAANRINALSGGPQWVVADGSGNPNGYGFDAGALPAEAERPWGTSEERDYPWYQDTWNFVAGEYVGFFADGLWGDVTGLVGLINPFDWDTFSASWGGLWTLTGGVFFDPAKTGNAWKEFGKSLVAWDRWSEDPGRAFGNVLYNVVTLPLAAAKVGTLGKGGKGAAAAADAGKAADAGRLAAAGRVLDEFGDVADVGKVDSLPTVGDLAKQIDLHLGDVLKQNPDLQRALRDADAMARVEPPQANTRAGEPAMVGAGRTGGGDPAPPRTGGRSDFPLTSGRDGGGADVPLTPDRGRGSDVPTNPARGGDGFPATPGRGGDVPTGPERTADSPDTPGRTADEPVNTGRAVDHSTELDRNAQDAPAHPGDDALGRPGTPADDAPAAPDGTSPLDAENGRGGPDTRETDGHEPGGNVQGERGPAANDGSGNEPAGNQPGSSQPDSDAPGGTEPGGNGPGVEPGSGSGRDVDPDSPAGRPGQPDADPPGGRTPDILSPAQREQFLNSVQRLGPEAEQQARGLLARTDLPPGAVEQAARDFLNVQDSGRLAGPPQRQTDILNDVLNKLNSDHTAFEGAAAELRAFNDVVDSGDLAPGSRVAFNAVRGEHLDLGNGTVLDIGDVPEADLVYQTADGTVHLDEVKATAQTVTNKLKSDPQQLERMLDWQDDGPDRQVGIRVGTDEGWTGLFSFSSTNPRTMGIEALARADVPITLGSRTLTPDELTRLHAAVEEAAVDPRHPMTKPGPWFAEHLPNLDAAREFLRGVDFL